MRVLHVVKKFPPAIGGDATAVAALARAQRRAGDEVTVLTFATGGPGDASVHRVGPGVTDRALDRITWRRLRGLAAMRRWGRTNLPALEPDVVHAHAVDVGWAVSPIAAESGIPSVLTCHGVWFPVHGRRSLRGRLEIALARRGRHRAVTSVDSASVAALHTAGFDRAVVVPNGVDLDEFSGPRARQRPFRFLFAGRHEPQKGLDVLLRACAILRREAREAFVVDLVGAGDLTAKLEAEARRAGLDGIVRFPGALPRADLVAAFRSADAFVLPSRYEGFPVTILEAWAAELPVIATTVGGIPDVCGPDGGLLVPPEDPAALAEAMATLLRDPTRRDALAATGHALARDRYSWDAVAVRYRDVYGKAMAG